MAQTQYTPGPWVLVENSWDVSTIYSPGGETVAQCPISGLVTEDTQDRFQAVMDANARLIAAAPELLGALRGMMKLRAPDLLTNKERADIINAAVEALVKAEGR